MGLLLLPSVIVDLFEEPFLLLCTGLLPQVNSRAVVGLSHVKVNNKVSAGKSNEDRSVSLLREVPGGWRARRLELATVVATIYMCVLSGLDILDVVGLANALNIPMLVLLVGSLLPTVNLVTVLPALVERSPGLGVLDAVGSRNDGHNGLE